MKSLLTWISQGFKKTSMSEEEKYLSQATSLEDLERRQKLLTYGKAPFQLKYQHYFDAHGNGRFYL